MADAAGAALFVDFDGTLAPIVDDPAASVPLAPAVDALGALARRLARVAVVSGRPVEFVRRHVPDVAVVVVGQYGLERDVDGYVEVDARAAAYQDGVAGAASEAEQRWPTLFVERKGLVATTIHWRGVPGAAPNADELSGLARRWGLTTAPGRMACELRPPLDVDKGTATRLLLGEVKVRVAAFAGDDYGDVEAFANLTEWVARRPGRAAVRVAVASDESPDELVEAADLVLPGPDALAVELTALAAALG